MTAALALLGARAGKRVLAIDVDAKGDLAAALGSPPAGFTPRVVQHDLSVLELRTDESFQEYLNIYFKVPRLTRLTPLARVFDFIATGVPGPRDMLVVGKIAYEERRKEPDSRSPVWDLILVDCAAGGQAESHLAAPKAMLTLVSGGLIRAQVEWIDALIRDPVRTTVVLCALPEEMPVIEAIELHERLRKRVGCRGRHLRAESRGRRARDRRAPPADVSADRPGARRRRSRSTWVDRRRRSRPASTSRRTCTTPPPATCASSGAGSRCRSSRCRSSSIGPG